MEKEKIEEPLGLKLSFLSYKEFDEGKAYRSAVLVTDALGKPLEFRTTSPVRPNPFQKVLYGKRLLPHILTNVMGAPLLRSIKENPSIILVQSRYFLSLRKLIEQPVICVRRQGETTSEEGGLVESKNPILINSEEFQPVVIESHPQYPEESKNWHEKLRGVFQGMDLLEPFERITKALEELDKRKALESQKNRKDV